MFKKSTGKKSLFAKFNKNENEKIIHSRGDKRSKSWQVFIFDELFYEKCFNKSDHKCEECGKQLNTDFRDEEGRIVNRWRYSHVIPKSIAPELRHDILNINNLCLFHHMMWENGDKESMKIYEGNVDNFPNFF